MLIYEDKLTAQEFVHLAEAVGWGCPNLKQNVGLVRLHMK